MSTCRGALPPHLNCPHGDDCDWEGRPDAVMALPPLQRMRAFEALEHGRQVPLADGTTADWPFQRGH